MLTLKGIGGDVVLPNPEVDDDWDLDLNTSVNTTVDGTPLIYKGDRPTYYEYTWAFTAVNSVKKEAFLVFVEANAGYEIEVAIDTVRESCGTGDLSAHSVQSILGYITTSDIIVTTDRDECSYSFGFSFMQTAGDTPIIAKYRTRT